MARWMFRDEMELAQINVPRAALHFARAIAYPELDVAAYMAALSGLSEAAVPHIDAGRPVEEQAIDLAGFMFDDLGFRGNTTDYADPRNSFLNEVLDRRMGIPITLSIVYVDLATRLGIPAYGIGLPGHFIVGVRSQDGDLWLDPFHGGHRIDLTDCAELIHLASGYQGPLEAGWFAPAPSRAILARMLGNLRAGYVSSESWAKAASVIQHLRQTQPDEAEHLRDLGLVNYHRGHLSQAAHYLNAYLQRAPDAADAQVIREGMKHLLDEWVPMN